MFLYLQTGIKVRIPSLVCDRQTYDALCMLAPLNPNLEFTTDRGETIKLYQISLKWSEIRDINL